MFRICCRNRPLFLFRVGRPISSPVSSLFSARSPSSSSSSSKNPTCSLEEGRCTKDIPPPSILRYQPPAHPLRAEFLSPAKLTALSATMLSAMIASYLFIHGSNADSFPSESKRDKRLYYDLHRTIERTSTSFGKIVDRMKHTGAAVCVLWQSLRSVLSSANHEVRAGFELRVASFLADIVAVNESRRSAIVGAGGGVVLDWLLQIVAASSDNSATQSESARALAYLIADPNVSGAVLGRPHAVPNLLRFIFSFQPKNKKKYPGHSSFDASHSLNGRSMLVAAIMDIITSSCDTSNGVSFQPLLSCNAEMRDIATVIQVIEEGSMHFDESSENEDDDDGGKGLRGIGIKVIGEAAVLGFSRVGKHTQNYSYHFNCIKPSKFMPMKLALHQKQNSSLVQAAVVPGLWDDLHCQHVAVPFAAWALANWAMASDANRARIKDLDQDGYAITTALMAPERTVKWHGILIARLLLEDKNIPITDSISDWSRSLLSTTSQASKIDDIPLTQASLSAFILAVEKCIAARKLIVSEGLPLMRETAKRTEKHLPLQEAMAKALELLCNSEMHISLEEGQRWSGILLSWIFGKSSSDCLRTSATKILTAVLEEQGSFSVPISQGWLALLLDEALNFNKRRAISTKNDKVKTQIDQSNISSANQTMNQLATAAVNSARRQFENTGGSGTFPFEDLLSLELFSKSSKGSKSESSPKFDAADSALKTLSAIKALANVCSYDASLPNRIVDFGVLCLLRRFLLQDDYEKLAAAEAYDASRSLDSADLHPATAKMSTGDASNIRVPPTAHIRRHAARLLFLLSLLGSVKDAIASDKLWCKWLEDCACGKITGCIDPKTQSYCRAALLNIFCNDKIEEGSGDTAKRNFICSQYEDMIFLINPHLPHWKCSDQKKFGGASPTNDDAQSIGSTHFQRSSLDNNLSASSGQSGSMSELPPLDVVFIHGLRGGPFKTWRIADDKISSKSGFVERIDQEAGKQGTFWPGEWLSDDFPDARLFTLRYKTNLTQWSGSSLPLQEVSSMLLDKLVAAGIGRRPVVFVTHSMGGLVVKQILFKAKKANIEPLIKNTIGIVFYSCPHFGSKLADMPWRMGFVLRPALSIGELRSGSSRLLELNDFIRNLHKNGLLDVLSFCETKVTPIVEGYGGWALRMEIVPIESAYPGFGELVVLESTDHVNSCKPLNRMDPSYKEMLNFLHKLKAECT